MTKEKLTKENNNSGEGKQSLAIEGFTLAPIINGRLYEASDKPLEKEMMSDKRLDELAVLIIDLYKAWNRR